MQKPLIKTAAGLLLAACALMSQAQTWPAQTIRVVVPFTPGTGMDTIARTVAPRLAERLGQPVVVQNTPGASGNIGADNVAKAQPDGYTVLMGAAKPVHILTPSATVRRIVNMTALTVADANAVR